VEFTLWINMDYEAAHNPDDLANLLRNAADKVQAGMGNSHVLDYNGNVVGWFKIEGD
jgi:hypothetical protein